MWYGKSYYRQLIGNHTLAFDWCHFWWPWSTFEGHFSLGCHFHVHFSYPWHAFASHGLPAIAELLVSFVLLSVRNVLIVLSFSFPCFRVRYSFQNDFMGLAKVNKCIKANSHAKWPGFALQTLKQMKQFSDRLLKKATKLKDIISATTDAELDLEVLRSDRAADESGLGSRHRHRHRKHGGKTARITSTSMSTVNTQSFAISYIFFSPFLISAPARSLLFFCVYSVCISGGRNYLL